MILDNSNPRRLFLKTALASVCASALGLMNLLARRTAEIPEYGRETLNLPLTPGSGVHFYEKAIVVADTEGLMVFSSACPHLGCRINQAEGDELVCPCHGSRFNLHGEVVHGPAGRHLKPLHYELDRASSILRVTLPNEQA